MNALDAPVHAETGPPRFDHGPSATRSRRGEPPVLAPDALAALLDQRFPGNVRELKNLIERALAFYPDQPVLRADHLGLAAPARLTLPPV